MQNLLQRWTRIKSGLKIGASIGFRG